MNNKTLNLLDLEDESRIPGIGPIWGNLMNQACSLCFATHEHPAGVTIELKYSDESQSKSQIIYYSIEKWQTLTETLQRQWGDNDVIAEYAAYGMTILFILDLTEYTVIERSRKGTGFDYWLGKRDQEQENPFKHEARLEVSGLLTAKTKRVNQRLKEKVEQTKQSDALNIPAYIGVVEFSKPVAYMVKR